MSATVIAFSSIIIMKNYAKLKILNYTLVYSG